MSVAQWVEGETAAKEFTLLAGSTVIDLTGATVEVVCARHDDPAVTIDFAGDVEVVAPSTSGKVKVSPDAADLSAAKSPLLVRFKVTDAFGKIAFVPDGEPDTWIIRKPTS